MTLFSYARIASLTLLNTLPSAPARVFRVASGLAEDALINRHENEDGGEERDHHADHLDRPFAVLADGDEFLTDGGPGLPAREHRNRQTADRHHEVRAHEVEEVEDVAARDGDVAPDAEGEGRDAAEEEERHPAEDHRGAAGEVPFVVDEGHDHFKERHRRGERRHQEADVEERREDVARRDRREDHRYRDEDEAGTGVRFDAEGEDRRHDHQTREDGGLNGEHRDPKGRIRDAGVLREVRAVRHENAGAQGEREEREAHGVQNRRGGDVFPLEAEEVLDARPGTRERQAAHDDREHQDEEGRHQVLRDAFDPLFDAQDDRAAGERQEHQMPGDVLRPVRDEFTEVGFEEVRIGRRDGAHEGVDEVRDAPAAHDRVVGENQVGGEYAEGAQRRIGLAAHVLHGGDDGPAAAAADRNFSHDQRYADREHEHDVRNDEGGAAVGAGPERKFPDRAEADGRAGARENEAEARAPLCVGSCHKESFFFFGL